jgi:hypothetical protein
MSIHPLLVPASLLFALHQLSQKWWQLSLPFADHYLDPLLCMPILLGIWQWEQQLLYKRSLTPADIWTATAALSVLFEVGFPYFSPGFTADWIDVILYFTGSALFLFTRGTYNSTKKQDLLQEV